MKLSKSLAISIATVAVGAASASAAMVLPQQNCSYTFSQNLKMGSKSSEVMNLQKVLNMYPQTMVASTGAGSQGMETMKFGPATRAAVVKLQNLYASEILTPAGLTKGSGSVYGLTRAVLNQLCTGNVGTNPNPNPTPGPVTSGPVSVSLAANQPMNVLVSGQVGAALATYNFSGNGTVTQIKLKKTGISTNDTVVNAYLYDGSVRVSDAASVLSDGTITFNNASGIFTVMGSKNITVRVDVLANLNGGQTIGTQLVGLTANGVMSSLSLGGTALPVSSVTLTTAYFSGSQTSNTTIDAGTMNSTLWSQTLNVGIRPVRFYAATFKQIGSAPYDAIGNFGLFIGGNKVASGMMSSNGYVSFVASTPVLVTTNQSVELRGDIVKGNDRNYYFSLENPSDFMVEDRDVMGAFLTVGGATTTAIKNSVAVTINAGSPTVQQDASYSTSEVLGGATNVTIGKFIVKGYGEDVKVTRFNFTPSLMNALPATDTLTSNLQNVSVYANGVQVGTSKSTWIYGNIDLSSLGSQFLIPAGQAVTVEVKADMVKNGSTAYTAGTVGVNIDNIEFEGLTSRKTNSQTGKSGQTFNIRSSQGTFAVTGGSSAKTVSPNTNSVELGSFTLQASSVDKLRVTSINVGLTGSTALTNLSNLTIKDGSTILGTPFGNPQTTNNFSLNLDVLASGSKTFKVYADVSNATSSSNVIVTATITYQGYANTNPTSTLATAATTTFSTGKVRSVTTFGTSETNQYVVSGSSIIAGDFNVIAENGDIILSKVNVAVTKLDGSSATGVTAVEIAGVMKNVQSGVATTTIDGLNISVPNSNSGISLPVKLYFANAGTNGVVSQDIIARIDSMEYRAGSQATTTASSSLAYMRVATTSAFTLVGSKPSSVKGVITLAGNQSNMTDQKIGEIRVTADAAGSVDLTQVSYSVTAPTGGTVTVVTLKLNGSTISNAVQSGVTSTSFTNGIRVSGGQTLVLDVNATITGVTSSSAVGLSVGPSSGFTWTDTSTGTTGLTGAKVKNFGN